MNSQTKVHTKALHAQPAAHTKALTVEKMDDKGQGLARIAILSAVDHDGDTYLPGAFAWKEGGQQWVQILPAHNRAAMPLGKARVYESGDAAFAELHLNLGSEQGREWHAALKFDLEKGSAIQEWSYGFGILDAVEEQRGGDTVRVLKRLDVHEVSPVVRGAGIGTGTLAIKAGAIAAGDPKSRGGFAGQIDAAIAEIDDIVSRAGGIKMLRQVAGREMSGARLEQLAALKARLDLLIGAGSAAQPTADEMAEAERLAASFATFDARRRFGA